MRKSFDFPMKISISLRILYAFLIASSIFFKTLMNAQKVPAAAVKCAMTTMEVLRVIVGEGTVYKTIKHLVLVSISIKSNYVELTTQMMCISLLS